MKNNKQKTPKMAYAVYINGICQDAHCNSLKEVKWLLKNSFNLLSYEVIRYDKTGISDYFEKIRL
jgi:hypothetical protein